MSARAVPRGVLIAVIVGLLWVLLPATASAGQWVQVSCENPDGSAAPSQGWTGTGSSSLAYPATANTACNPGAPMAAVIPQTTTAVAGGGETLTYTPPAGSSLAGGTMAVQLSADGYGQNPAPNNSSGAALVLSPQNSVATEVETCAEWSNGCWAGDSVGSGGPDDFKGTITLPANSGGTVNVEALCLYQGSATACNQGGNDGVWAGAWIFSSDLLLSTTATPTASNVSGSLLAPNASGTAQLTMTAAESSGPGIYNVTVAVDGNTVYSATPDTNNGACVSEGTYAGTSAMEFDYAQPCPLSEDVSVPIDTTSLSDGAHALTVTVTDAAGVAATVVDQGISVLNSGTATVTPAQSPAPATNQKSTAKAMSKVNVRFVLKTHFTGAITRLLDTRILRLPKDATLLAAVSGPKHPKLKLTRDSAQHAKAFYAALAKLRYRAGDTLVVTVTVPHRKAERLQLTFRNGKQPTAKLLYGVARAKKLTPKPTKKHT